MTINVKNKFLKFLLLSFELAIDPGMIGNIPMSAIFCSVGFICGLVVLTVGILTKDLLIIIISFFLILVSWFIFLLLDKKNNFKF